MFAADRATRNSSKSAFSFGKSLPALSSSHVPLSNTQLAMRSPLLLNESTENDKEKSASEDKPRRTEASKVSASHLAKSASAAHIDFSSYEKTTKGFAQHQSHHETNEQVLPMTKRPMDTFEKIGVGRENLRKVYTLFTGVSANQEFSYVSGLVKGE